MTDVDAPAKIEMRDIQLRYPARGKSGDFLAVDLLGEQERSVISFQPGEFAVILGPSGCGKSSLLRLIAGFEKPSHGTVLVDGKEVTGPGRNVGMVFQSYTTFPWLTVEQNVMAPFGFREGLGNRSKGELKDKAHEMLELVRLLEARNKYPSQLSGGMKQRVAIARTLVNDPDILLMDEPFGALDPHIRVEMQQLVLDIEKDMKTTILFITHDAREAVMLGDSIYISTLVPCFLKYRIEHPFVKESLPREEAKRKYAKDFANFQHQVEDRLNALIDNPGVKRAKEEGDTSSFYRTYMGMIDQLGSGH